MCMANLYIIIYIDNSSNYSAPHGMSSYLTVLQQQV